MIGQSAGYLGTTGSNNVMIGYQAGYSETGSNKLYIDNSNTTSPLIYGDFANDELTINGTLKTITGGAGYLNFSTGGSSGIIKSDFNLDLYADDAANNSIGYQNIRLFTAGSNERMRIAYDGNVGIGTTSPTFTSGSGLEISHATQANLRVTDSNASGSSSDFAQSGDNLYIINRHSTGSINIIASGGAITFGNTSSAGNFYTFPTTAGTSGDVLKTDGSGTLSWTTPSSGGGGTYSFTGGPTPVIYSGTAIKIVASVNGTSPNYTSKVVIYNLSMTGEDIIINYISYNTSLLVGPSNSYSAMLVANLAGTAFDSSVKPMDGEGGTLILTVPATGEMTVIQWTFDSTYGFTGIRH